MVDPELYRRIDLPDDLLKKLDSLRELEEPEIENVSEYVGIILRRWILRSAKKLREISGKAGESRSGNLEPKEPGQLSDSPSDKPPSVPIDKVTRIDRPQKEETA